MSRLPFIIFFLVGTLVAGCTGYSKIKDNTVIDIIYPDGSRFTQKTNVNGTVVAPVNPEGPSGLKVNDSNAFISGTWESAVNNLATSSGWIFYTASVILIVAGVVVGYFLKQYMFALILGGSGILIAGIPSVLDELGLIVIIGVISFIAMGLMYVFGKSYALKDVANRGKKAIVKLKKEGKDEEATAIARAIDKNLDESYEKSSTP